jgi:hypothetical protein
MEEQPSSPQDEPTPAQTPKLDYYQPQQTPRSQVDKLILNLIPPSDLEQRKWWYRRVYYRGALSVYFAAMAFYFGPNWIEFGKLTRPSMADFVPAVEQWGVPLVKAVKQYKLQHGRIPKDDTELVPAYLDSDSDQTSGFRTFQGEVIGYVGYDETVRYDFSPGTEGWFIEGPYVTGKLPLPPVTIDPFSRPRTQPAR